MAYWVFKTEPEDYSWERLEQDKTTKWTGIRNFQARNYLREMHPGDIVFVYHSGEERHIVGLAKVITEPYKDETAEKGEWVAIDIEAIKPLVRIVSLEEIKNTHGLSVMPLASQGRLSIQPMTEDQAKMILKIAKTNVEGSGK